MKDIPSGSIDLIITDPPYEIAVTHGAGAFGTNKLLNYKQCEGISSGFDSAVLDECVRVLKKINIYIWASKAQIPKLFDFFVKKHKCYFNILCWHKTNPVPACNNKYLGDTEYLLFFREKGVHIFGEYKSKFTYYVTPTNIVDKKKYGHPTIKPLHIIENLIINSSSPGDIVLDLFLGSGTVAVAAVNTGRHYIGYELNPEYFTTAEKRIEEAKQLIKNQNIKNKE